MTVRVCPNEVWVSDWAKLPDGTELVKDDYWHIGEEVSPGVFKVYAEFEDVHFEATEKFILDNAVFYLGKSNNFLSWRKS